VLPYGIIPATLPPPCLPFFGNCAERYFRTVASRPPLRLSFRIRKRKAKPYFVGMLKPGFLKALGFAQRHKVPKEPETKAKLVLVDSREPLFSFAHFCALDLWAPLRPHPYCAAWFTIRKAKGRGSPWTGSRSAPFWGA
jgi:hypothetical protein